MATAKSLTQGCPNSSLEIPGAFRVPLLSPHQFPGTSDKHSRPTQGIMLFLSCKPLLGRNREASWPHFEHSCPQFLLQSSAKGWAWLGSGGQTVPQKRETQGQVWIHPFGSVQAPAAPSHTDADFLLASQFQSQTGLETFQNFTPGSQAFQK